MGHERRFRRGVLSRKAAAELEGVDRPEYGQRLKQIDDAVHTWLREHQGQDLLFNFPAQGTCVLGSLSRAIHVFGGSPAALELMRYVVQQTDDLATALQFQAVMVSLHEKPGAMAGLGYLDGTVRSKGPPS